LREEIDCSSMFEEIVGSSAALRQVLAQVAKDFLALNKLWGLLWGPCAEIRGAGQFGDAFPACF
jgi:hypothetical protein